MLRIWICLLALVSQACLAMEVSPHFSRQLEPVMKLYQSGQWQQAQNKAAGLKPGSDAERAWLAQLQASLAANLQQTAQASRYVEQALAYKEWPEQQQLQLLRLRGDIQAQQSNWSAPSPATRPHWHSSLTMPCACVWPASITTTSNMARRSARASSC